MTSRVGDPELWDQSMIPGVGNPKIWVTLDTWMIFRMTFRMTFRLKFRMLFRMMFRLTFRMT